MWEYTYIKRFSDPLTEARRNDKGEVTLDAANLALPWQGVLAETNQDTKLIFVTRHGRSIHNDKSSRYGKALYYEFFARDPADVDPELAPEGKAQARKVGEIMPFACPVYSSPLRRCFLTAIYATEQPVHIKEGLREWMGWDHNHSSDKRSPLTTIRTRAASAGGEVVVDASFTETDMATKRETFADVRLRVRNVLDEIYDTDEASAFHLFLHNRCFRSFLRVIGHMQEQEFDMANGATVAFLVHRRQADKEDASGMEELLAIQKDKDQLSATAQGQVRRMSDKEASEILDNLLTETDRERFMQWRNTKDED